ncbi:hypothetical protein [Aquabacterium humicola]|uniref:hypothetical protein n=1 Tax=Aquabacterium humicola TaxID=3237377 RepID=UPI002543AF4E|nr:hypothetical protein [Rubrivivax pictus]
MSSDVWALLVAYGSNWLPILLLVSFAAMVLVIFPHTLVSIHLAISKASIDESLQVRSLWAATLFLALFAGLVRRLTMFYRSPLPNARYPFEIPPTVFWGSLTVSLAFTFAVSVFYESLTSFDIFAIAHLVEPTWRSAVIALQFSGFLTVVSLAVAYLLSTRGAQWLLSLAVGQAGDLFRCPAPIVAVVAAAALSTLVTTATIVWIIDPTLKQAANRQFEPIVAFGPLTVLATMATSELIGSLLTHPYQRDMDRAFSARVGGWMLAAAIGWCLVSSISLYGYQLRQAGGMVLSSIVVAVTAALGIVWWLLGVIPSLLFGAGLLFLWAMSLIVFPVLSAAPSEGHAAYMLFALGVTAILTLMLARLVNVNRFSLHSLYKEGLVRTFLGASRLAKMNPRVSPPPSDSVSAEDSVGLASQFISRRAHPVTDTDDDDDPGMMWLTCRPGREIPIFLFNAAVNGRSHTDHEGRVPRQWPFTFSPYYSGSPVSGIGYAETRHFSRMESAKGITLGTAMAVSGAAMSPTAGRSTHPIKAFILGVLNARLGLWIGNPMYPDAVHSGKPPLAGFTVLREMLGLRSKFSRWIHLSDGGHFENLGLYELVRRGCRRIILVDATCDPQGDFSDLANAIRRVSIDLGITIKRGKTWSAFQDDALARNGKESTHGGWTWLDIDYGEGLPRGRILYLKPSTRNTARLEVDVRNYWLGSESFPHETTADQFFSEEQMEAYRALGEETCAEALKRVLVKPTELGQEAQYDQDPRLTGVIQRAILAKYADK